MEKRSNVKEYIVYLAVIILLLVAPVLSESMRTLSGESVDFNWRHVLRVWVFYIPFFVAFLIHNFFIAPLLIERKKKVLYFGTTAVLVLVFQLVQCAQKPDIPDRIRQQPRMAQDHGRPADMGGKPVDGPDVGGKPVDGPDVGGKQADGPDVGRPEGRQSDGDGGRMRRHGPPPFIGERDAISFFVILMLIGMNLGVKLYFKSERDHHLMDEMRRQNLEQQIAYLTYQINPHFFMNTLNNIHALVDIEPEKAKATILELSKLMRFVLYDGNKSMVSLSKELAFLKNYITLMQLRYTEKVRIEVSLPEPVPEIDVPPLLFITFVENAFKHGISYNKESFVDIRLQYDGNELTFCCRNSKADKPHGDKGGVGLSNVRQRLDLIYGDRYSLDIHDQDNTFEVCLKV